MVYVRETKVKNPGFYLCKHLINKYCDDVLFISDFDRKSMSFRAKNQLVVRDCLDFDLYEVGIDRAQACDKFGLDRDKFNLLYVGGDDELKGYSVMVSAIQKITAPEIHLVVAGDVHPKKKIYAENIKYLGKVFDMPTLYHACDALVFPSTKGHQARPVFEAGAAGLPVIISDFPETADAVNDGANGLVFEPCNADALADKINKLHSSVGLVEQLGAKNRENAQAKHDFSKVQTNLLSIVES